MINLKETESKAEIKLDTNKINENIDAHEEMCYLIEDDVKEI